MANGGKVYGVRWWNDAWEVNEAEVAEETATEVVLAVVSPSALGNLGAFDYRQKHKPASLARSPADAVSRKLAEEKAAAAKMVADIAQQHDRIRRLEVLGARIVRG